MGDNSKIEWTDATWNPVTGCTKVSPGCDHCYAERVTERFSGPGSFARVQLHEDRLDLPLRWRKPRRVFVNSMSDLFHEAVPDEFIARVFAVMTLTPWHTFQVLTKRHGRMRSLLSSGRFADLYLARYEWLESDYWRFGSRRWQDWLDGFERQWPLPNVWLGVSVEDQHWADIRIPALVETPAAVRFLSCEPLIGSVDLDRYLWLHGPSTAGPFHDYAGRRRGGGGIGGQAITSVPAGDLHWVIAGGESGPGARPMCPDWARLLRDRCREARVPFFFKQWGEWAPTGYTGVGGTDPRQIYVRDSQVTCHEFEGAELRRVGKRAAGRMLDGRTWDEYPQEMAVA